MHKFIRQWKYFKTIERKVSSVSKKMRKKNLRKNKYFDFCFIVCIPIPCFRNFLAHVYNSCIQKKKVKLLPHIVISTRKTLRWWIYFKRRLDRYQCFLSIKLFAACLKYVMNYTYEFVYIYILYNLEYLYVQGPNLL